MQKHHLILLLLFVFGFSKKQKFDYQFDKPDVESALGTVEDPLARINYETQMLASPKTGLIPENIRRRELNFHKRLTKEANYLRKSNARIAELEWQLAGPYNVGGRTRAAGIDVLNETTIISGGVSGGIWKTIDEGSNWKRVTDPDSHQGVSCIAQDIRSGKESIWYAGTGEQLGNSARGQGAVYRGNGILKSEDNGETWSPMISTTNESPHIFNSQFQYIWKVIPNTQKTDIDELLVATYGGILRSQDAGDNWGVVLGNELFNLPEGTDINESADPSFTNIIQTSSGHFFASLSSATSITELYAGAGIFFSSDGENWTEITPPALPDYHERIVFDAGASSPGQVYFMIHIGGNQAQLWRYTYSSVSAGKPNGTWDNLTQNIPMLGGSLGDLNLQSGYNMLIKVHPENPQVVYLGGTNLYRSTDGFTSTNRTKWIGGYNPDQTNAHYPSHHADQHLLLFFPSNSEKMLSTHDGGLSRTTRALSDSVTYISLNNGYLTSQFYTITQDQSTYTETMIGGMQDNGAYIRDAPGINTTWNRLINGDGGYMGISPNKDFVYTGFQNGLIFRITLNSTNEIVGFGRVDPAGAGESSNQEYLFINPFLLDPENPNKMFVAGGNTLWRNHNLLQIPNGSNNKTSLGWEQLPDTRIGTGIYTSLEKSKDVVYAGIYRQQPSITKVSSASTPEQEVTAKNLGFSVFPSAGYISCISAAPDNPDIMLVTFSNYEIPSIYLSLNGGDSFVDVSGNLEEFPDGSGDGPSVRWAEIVPTPTGYKYFVGTSIGLFSTELNESSTSANTTWVKEGAQEIGKSIVTMMNYRSSDGRMVIATHGNGAYRAFIDNPVRTTEPETDDFKLGQNFPNPVIDKTLINFTIPQDEVIRIDLYDDQGRLIKNLLWGIQYSGENTITWDGTDAQGATVRAGTYIYTLSYKGKTKSKRLVFIK